MKAARETCGATSLSIPKPLSGNTRFRRRKAGHIAAWPGQAHDEPQANRIADDAEYNRDRAALAVQSCGRECRTRENDFGLQSDQFFRKAFSPLSASGSEAIVYPDVFPLRPSELFEVLPKCHNACLKLRIGLRAADQRADPPHPLGFLRA
jgi:hypothetical protein